MSLPYIVQYKYNVSILEVIIIMREQVNQLQSGNKRNKSFFDQGQKNHSDQRKINFYMALT